ncbi:fam-c protein [Plasmodium vinckei lentum]|uniref:Fam-c protein n=1 Tax=Plasmodium vinckei lentum TaxID=138297 RepID=A0A6V7SHW4_PLAVN|nr:fam-c protein [Plasmodium vinckei lentum]
MNKRIFSLVCILFYVFMAVSIYCSEQKHDQSKTSGLRSRIVRAIKKISGSNKKNDIESERENQSNNNNNKDVSDDEDNFKYRNRKKYEEMDDCYTYCCGLFCGDDDYVPDSFYSHSVHE